MGFSDETPPSRIFWNQSICFARCFCVKENSRRFKMPRPHKPVHPNVSALEWIGELSGRTARATCIGSRRLLIENHTGIRDFTDETVRLSTATGSMCVHGQNLTLCEVRENALIVHGCIRQVELPDDGGAQ